MHSHAILVKFHGPTDSKGSRVSFKSLFFGDRREVHLPSEYMMLEFASQWLEVAGYDNLRSAECPEGYIFFTSTFEPITDRERQAKAARRSTLES